MRSPPPAANLRLLVQFFQFFDKITTVQISRSFTGNDVVAHSAECLLQSRDKLQDKLEEQGADGIYKRNGEYSLGRLIAMRIDVKSEKRNIEYQAGYRDSGDLVLVFSNKMHTIRCAEK